MSGVLIGAAAAALLAGLLVLRVRYGELRVSELPVLLLALLAGSEGRARLRLILQNRDMATVPPTMPRAGAPPRPKRGSAVTLQRYEAGRRYDDDRCRQCEKREHHARNTDEMSSEYRENVESLKGMAVTQSPETTETGETK